LRFFLDNNLAPKLARGFHQFVLGEHEVVHLRDRFSQETPDVEWMQQLADESGWVILSGDVAIGRNPHEVEAWKSAGHTIFFLKAWLDQSAFLDSNVEIREMLPEVLRAAERAKKGSSFYVSVTGKIEK
jgi:hypothetical protein